jgi:glutamyl-tRNA synthetase
LEDVIAALRERSKTLVDMAEGSRFLYEDFSDYDAVAAEKHLTAQSQEPLTALRDRFASLPEWSKEAIHGVITEVAQGLGLKMGQIAQPLRVALSGGTVSPPIDVTVQLLGKERTLERIERALAHIQSGLE